MGILSNVGKAYSKAKGAVVISVKNIFAKNDSIHTLENARTYLSNQKEKLESVI
jgi:hypothetical protein